MALALTSVDWICITNVSDVDLAYDKFLCITGQSINSNIPCKSITIPHSTHSYITPLIKSLLRKRSKLTKVGKTADALSLSVKIGKLVTDQNLSEY